MHLVGTKWRFRSQSPPESSNEKWKSHSVAVGRNAKNTHAANRHAVHKHCQDRRRSTFPAWSQLSVHVTLPGEV